MLAEQKTTTVKLEHKDAVIGRDCEICGGFFPLYSSRDNRRICQECLRRLRELLYGGADNAAN